MIIKTSRKNTLTKNQIQKLFDTHIKSDLDKCSKMDFISLSNYKPKPITIFYDKYSQEIMIFTGKHVTKEILNKSQIKNIFFNDLAKECVMLKLRGENLDIISKYFIEKVLSEANKSIKILKHQKEFKFKTKERKILFKGYVCAGIENPNKVITQDFIQNYISLNDPEGYKYLKDTVNSRAKINRKIGYIIIDNMRSGMVGIDSLGDAEYVCNFTDVVFNFDGNKVLVSSHQPFISRTGTNWTQSGIKRENSHRYKVNMSCDTHPLGNIFKELNIPEKYLPKNKKDTKALTTYGARNLSRKDFNKLNSEINNWIGGK